MAFHALQGAIALAVVLMALIMPSVSALPNLRILPLGDSITKGSGSTGIVGYRGPLREKLTKEGISVDMIGTLKDGNMEDDNHEGHSGKYLAQINGWWQKPVKARPNVVLIHAGTNNMDKEVDLDIAIDLMTEIVDGIFKAAPDVTICLAPVIWANNPAMQANTDRFNPQVRNLIKDRQSAGKHILEVPTDITVSDLSDLKHPNNQGYEKMANAWLKAITEADSRGWLKTPVKMSPSDAPGTGLGIDGANEGEAPVNVWRKEGTIFDGFRTWEEVGTISGPLKEAGRVILADLNGDGISDYIVADDDGTVRAWLYEGKPTLWKSLGKVNPDWDTIKGDMIRLADVDNDGKADLIALFSDGAARVWKNTKDGAKFESLDSKWATGLASREKVHFEDVDGDGYVDYVVIDSDGSVKWARNTHNNGKDSNKKNWEDAETIAPGPAGIPNNRARLRDLDGDGKADYLVVYDGGAVKAWRNSGRLNSGPGTNWHDLGTIAPGISGVTGDMVQFADMDGDGLADFLAVAKDGSIRMWKNRGIVSVKGESLRLADINGDGKADIISVDARGRARAWVNNNGKFDDIGEIAPGFNNNMTSARIEFEDVDGDGLADYLIIYGGGAVKAYLNNGNIGNMGSPNVGSGKESRIWKEGITISPGVGEPGSKVRFADLDGDGTADYLILYDGGAVKAWLNRGNIGKNNGERLWKDGYTVATGVGEPGEKIRFADLTGDKRAEYIVQYDGGAAKGYRNTGNIPRAGKDRNWNLMGTVAAGVTPQGPVHYADINGDGKADYLVVFDGGAINAYVNKYDWDKQLPGEGGNNGEDDDGEDDNNPEGPVGFTPSLETFFNFVSGDSKNEPFGATGSVLRPPVRMQKWIALGDSYAAGPGAGNTVEDDMPDCQRGEAAYPYQMQRDESLPGPDGALGERPEFTFKACTGDKTTQMLDRANPNYQLAPISEFTNVATLSIGGNDVGFAKILKPCLYLEFAGPSCDEAIAEARKRMYGPDFGPRYFKVLQEIVDRMAWKRRDNQYTAIFQTGYSQFFDDYTTQCNQVGFLYWGAGIRVTQELRAKLNQLTHELNYVLQYWIALFNTRNTRDRNRWELPTTPVHFVNVDLFYNGHRFCREGVQEPDFRNTNTHFFHLLAAHQEKVEQNEATNYTKDEVEAMVEKYYAQEPVTATMPIDVVKAFHPTPRGFRDTSMAVISKFQYQMAARQFALRGGRFNLMVLGDYVAYASQDPNSNIYQGFIPHLQAVFRNRAFYGSPSIPGFSISPDFIGSRQPQSYNGQPHECWQTATLERLGDELKKSANLGTQGKVVILMAGTIDVLYNIDFDKAEERMNRILQILIQNDEEVSILLVQIPLIGAAEDADGTTWYELQRRIVSFNAMLAGLANIYLTRGWGKVLLVHASATPLEHNDGDLILPSADGYRRIAHDLAEALVYAKGYGWLESSQNSQPTTTSKRDSLPAPGSIKRGVEGGILICNDRDKFSKKQPSKEDIRDSFLQGLKIDDFIEKIACNRTELCKISQDGLHGDPLQPSMLSFNATVCQRTGGKPGNPNLLNTQVRMPSPDYELAKSECSGIIKDIIDYCVMENNAIGGAWRPADEHPKRERDLHIIMQGSNLDQVQIDSRSYEADFLDQGAVRQLLQSNVALSRP